MKCQRALSHCSTCFQLPTIHSFCLKTYSIDISKPQLHRLVDKQLWEGRPRRGNNPVGYGIAAATGSGATTATMVATSFKYACPTVEVIIDRPLPYKRAVIRMKKVGHLLI